MLNDLIWLYQLSWFWIILSLIFAAIIINDPVFWFMMQVGMCIGFLTTYPANWILVRVGIKHTM
jgi:hypothetical protein